MVVAGIALCVSLSQQAAADGYFLQADLGGQTQGLVAASSTGAIGYGFNAVKYEGGRAGAISVTHAWPLGHLATLRPSRRGQREWTEHGGHAGRFLFATVSRPSRTAALVTATR